MAALVIDSTSQPTISLASSASWSHTCTGSSRALIVGVLDFADAGTGYASVSAVTYGGVSLTPQGANAYDGGAWWVLINPASGSGTIAVTSSSGSRWIVPYAMSVQYANQTTALSDSAFNAPTTSLAVANLTADDLALGYALDENASGNFTAGSGTTVPLIGNFTNINRNIYTGFAYATGTGSVSVNVARTSTTYVAMMGIRVIGGGSAGSSNTVFYRRNRVISIPRFIRG